MDEQKIRMMYDTIRKDEIRNDKTGQFSDKEMVDRITKYLYKKAKEEVDKQ